ncbi:MAG TPA: hypothetical protein VJ935_02435 [Acidimicrobiia bacterium]|nr:hypothetical protein [Acidimicrobiia bacterium]
MNESKGFGEIVIGPMRQVIIGPGIVSHSFGRRVAVNLERCTFNRHVSGVVRIEKKKYLPQPDLNS